MSDSTEINYITKPVLVTSYDQFKRMCEYMNNIFGRGRKNWRVRNNVKRHFQRKTTPKWINFKVHKKHIDKTDGFELFLTLM